MLDEYMNHEQLDKNDSEDFSDSHDIHILLIWGRVIKIV